MLGPQPATQPALRRRQRDVEAADGRGSVPRRKGITSMPCKRPSTSPEGHVRKADVNLEVKTQRPTRAILPRDALHVGDTWIWGGRPRQGADHKAAGWAASWAWGTLVWVRDGIYTDASLRGSSSRLARQDSPLPLKPSSLDASVR